MFYELSDEPAGLVDFSFPERNRTVMWRTIIAWFLEARPEIVSGLKPATVKQGEPAVFEVKTKEPVKQVKWYKNGKEMENPQTEEKPAECAYRLIIPSAQADDQAEYKVGLVNVHAVVGL